MKNRLVLALGIILLLASCSQEETETQGVQTRDVVFTIDQPTTAPTGKQIKRSNIPIWVNTIKIKATSNVFTYSTEDNYTFDQTNGASFIGLDNVAIGANTFTASTTTDSPQFFQLTNFTVNSGTFDSKFSTALDNIDNENPYVLYTGSKTETIASTGSSVVALPMLTNNGRILSVFQVTDQLKTLGLQAKITASVTGETAQTATTKSNEIVTFKWSNANAIADKEVTYKIEVSAINAQNTILKTYEVKQKIVASTSISCFYTINSDGITFTKNNVTITLNFQEWKNETCLECKN